MSFYADYFFKYMPRMKRTIVEYLQPINNSNNSELDYGYFTCLLIVL